MVHSIEIDQVVSYLKATSAVANIVSDRIFFWEPMREQTWIYVVINSISQVVVYPDKQALVEFRIIGNNENVTKKQLADLANTISSVLVLTDTNKVYKFWTFNCYKVVEWWNFRMFVDDKNRNLLVRDYIFYFLYD